MRMAEIMAQQEASGFRFDVKAAERVRGELQQEMMILKQIKSRYVYVPGKVYTPKRANKTKGYIAGAPMTKLLDFNPTSRQHIAWALQNFRGARFTKVTDTGKPKVDEATLSEMRDIALQQGNEQAARRVWDVHPSSDTTEVAGSIVWGGKLLVQHNWRGRLHSSQLHPCYPDRA